jgi:calcium-translocating P-type ATPase
MADSIDVTPTEGTVWHAVDAEVVSELLETGRRGLQSAEAARRLEVHGPNELTEEPPPGPLVVFARQFRSPLIFILLVAAIVTALLDEWIDTWVIAAVLLLNAAIGFFQERKAEESVRALRTLISPQARVLRDGHERHLPSRDLVPGDVVLLESGTRVPADIRLSHAVSLHIDESLLTGESLPVHKEEAPVPEAAVLGDRSSMAYAGSVVASGRGRGYVVETGENSQLGAIAAMMRQEVSPDSPLQIRMARLARLVGIVVAIAAVFAFVLGVLLGRDTSEMFRFAVALAVSAIPEGLPVVLTITLAVGVRRMANRKALIRRLAAVETLGSTTVIGSDKTGTLTENRMTVQRIWARNRSVSVDDAAALAESALPPEAVRATLVAGVLANEADIYLEDGELHIEGDPTEAALLVAASKFGIEPAQLREEFSLSAEIPFESERMYSAVVGELDGVRWVFLKGAPERVVEMCDRSFDGPLDADTVLATATEMAGMGLRVLAMARAAAPPEGVLDIESHISSEGLEFLGLQGMLDPPRAGVAEAVAGCKKAGIRPVMITGDHAVTARAIAARIGIAGENDPVLTGIELDVMSDDQLEEAVDTVAVFARVAPEHKLRIVQALQRRGQVVAVTGDGVNDAPALKAADIGVAMGAGGTDVARQASDMVLADDNFASIYAAVEEGRVTFDNVRKVTFFLVSSGAAEITALTAGLVLGWPLVMLPTQILWLNLVTNGVQDVALAFEPAEPGIVDRPPRPMREGVVGPLLWKRTALVGVVMAIGTLGMFRWELAQTGSVDSARTAALTTMVLFKAVHLGNVRSERVSAFKVPITSNRFLLIAAALALGIHVAALYMPFTQFVLGVQPLSIGTWLRAAAVAVSVLVVGELHKLWENRR